MKVGDLVKTCYYCVDNVGIIIETDGNRVRVLWASNFESEWEYFTNLEVINESR